MGAAAAFLPWAQAVYPMWGGQESGMNMRVGWLSLLAFLACAVVLAVTRGSRMPSAARVTMSVVGATLLILLGAFAVVYPGLWRAAGATDHPYLNLSAHGVRTSLALGWYASAASAAILAAGGAVRMLWR
jgi:hypothetical protein